MNLLDRLRGGYWLPEETTVERYRRLLAQPDPEDLPRRGYEPRCAGGGVSRIENKRAEGYLSPWQAKANRILRIKRKEA